MKFKDTKYGDLTGQHYMDNIMVNGMGLTSLEGAPREVTGSFNCSDNDLSSLEYGPDYVTGYYNATGNKKITSLKGCATIIRGAFWCDKSSIKPADVMSEIAKNSVKASRYMIDKFITDYNSNIKDETQNYKNLNSKVKSKGFRSMLGLDK